MSIVKKAIKNSIRFELGIEPIIEKLKEQCPPKEEFQKMVEEKNQLINGIEKVRSKIGLIDKTAKVEDIIIKVVDAGLKIIKNLPIPTSVPPGIGLPMNIINKFTDLLDVLGAILFNAKGLVNQIIMAVEHIDGILSAILEQLNYLDALMGICYGELAEDFTDEEKEDMANNFNQNTDNSSNPEANKKEGEELLNRLSPESNNPILYPEGGEKEYKFEIQFNPQNTFTFPLRRVVAIDPDNGIYFVIGPWSFSATTQILVEEVKFIIDQKLAGLPLPSSVQTNISEDNVKGTTTVDGKLVDENGNIIDLESTKEDFEDILLGTSTDNILKNALTGPQQVALETEAKVKEAESMFYTTKQGDIVKEVAEKFNISVGQLKSWNDIKTYIEVFPLPPVVYLKKDQQLRVKGN